MKRKSFLRKLTVAVAVCLVVVSCGMGGSSGPIADDYIANQESLNAQVDKLFEKAGTSAERVELADVSFWRTLSSSGALSNYMSLKMVNPKDKDQMKEFL